MTLVLVALLPGCTPGSGFDDKPTPSGSDSGSTDSDADTDADADSDADSDADTDTASTGDTGLTALGTGLVNEVLATPPVGLAGDANCDGTGSAEQDEFVEVVNVGAIPLDLADGQLTVDGTARHVFGQVVLDPGDTLVVFGGGAPTFDGTGASGAWCAALPAEVTVETASSGALSLPATGGAVRVVDRFGRVVDEVTYGVAADQSLNRQPELQDTPLVGHLTLPGADRPFSPGTLADGRPITAGPDETGDTGGTGVGTPATLYDIQQDLFPVGTEVATSGVLTGIGADGVYVEDPGGGALSGAWVYLGPGFSAVWGALVVGDAVDLVGQVQEPLGNTTIDLTVSAGPELQVTASAPEPAPVGLSVAELSTDPESYEGVLLQLGPLEVSAVVGNEIDLTDLGGGPTLRVGDQLAAYSGLGALQVGTRFDAISGVFYRGANWYLAPRGDADFALSAPLALRINEVLGDPPSVLGDANCDGVVDASADEFVEIWNLGLVPVDLTGLTLSDTVTIRHRFTGAVDPGGAVVVFGGGTPTFDGSGVAGTWCAALRGTVSVQVASTGSLNVTNSGDTLTLASGLVPVDTVTFGAEINGDQSLNRDPDLGTGALVAHSGVAGAVNPFSPGTLVDGVPAPYRATITVDGDPADFPADSAFTTSAGTTAHVAWDGSDLYLAFQHPDVALGPGLWVVVYVGDGGAGTTTGLTLGGQTPTLPFAASHAVKWSTDGSASALATWNGAAWTTTAGWLGTAGSAVADDDGAATVELALPLGVIGSGPTLNLVAALVDTTSGAEVTVDGLPSTAFADGAADPDYAEAYAFHPNLAPAPNTYLPVP